MKLADVEEGKVYAIGKPNATYDIPYKARIVEIGKFYKNTRSWGRGSKRRRAKVETLEDSKRDPWVVDAREILMPWDEYEAQKEKEKRKKQEAKERRERNREENELLQVEICDKLEEMGFEISRIFDLPRVKKFRRMDVDYHGCSEAKMSFEALEELIERVYEEGRKDGMEEKPSRF